MTYAAATPTVASATFVSARAVESVTGDQLRREPLGPVWLPGVDAPGPLEEGPPRVCSVLLLRMLSDPLL